MRLRKLVEGRRRGELPASLDEGSRNDESRSSARDPLTDPLERLDLVHDPFQMNAVADRSPVNRHGIVLDPFCGSGSTLVAADRLGRGYYGIDIVIAYCERARRRLGHFDKKDSFPEAS